MKLLSGHQIKDWDQFTIVNEPISSIDLMERASRQFTYWFIKKFDNPNVPVVIFCGNGNNGGDGLAVARLLRNEMYDVQVYILRFAPKDSADFETNLLRLQQLGDVKITFIGDYFPNLTKNSLIIDALMGTGVNRRVEGTLSELIRNINLTPNRKISIDLPSGLPSEGECLGDTIMADQIFTFQLPKLSFFLKVNAKYCCSWQVGDIGLHPMYLESVDSKVFKIDLAYAKSLYRPRQKHTHKGDFGHAAIVAGCKSTFGAAMLSAKACIKSGAGLVTAFVPNTASLTLLGFAPEVMISACGEDFLQDCNADWTKYTIGVGPGLGQRNETAHLIKTILTTSLKPIVIDADGLNILAEHSDWLPLIPRDSILTPHPKEMERLFGRTNSEIKQIELAKKMAQKYQINIVLKGAFTRIFTPTGMEYINTTGNPGMATAGAGDVLTGIITSLLAQGYGSKEAAILGVYVHGLAGDCAISGQSHESLIASDIIYHLGDAFKQVAMK